jgi:hypothetical protein
MHACSTIYPVLGILLIGSAPFLHYLPQHQLILDKVDQSLLVYSLFLYSCCMTTGQNIARIGEENSSITTTRASMSVNHTTFNQIKSLKGNVLSNIFYIHFCVISKILVYFISYT